MYVLLFRRRFILAKPFPYNTLLQIYCIVLFLFCQCFSENFRNFGILHNIFKNPSRSLHTVESFQAVFNLYDPIDRNFLSIIELLFPITKLLYSIILLTETFLCGKVKARKMSAAINLKNLKTKGRNRYETTYFLGL